MPSPAADFDSAWKEFLHHSFRDFLAFFFPDVHDDIDWEQDIEFLDKELQYAVRRAGKGRRAVDCLAKVYRRNGEEKWVLAHVEVQGQPEDTFCYRMFLVNSLVSGRHKRPVASFAILGDASPDWRENEYRSSLWGTEITMRFPFRKLLDFEKPGGEEELAKDPNPVAMMVLANLKTQRTRRKPESRLRWKVRILRWLHQQGRPEEQFVDLFRYLDLMMALPERLQREFDEEVERIEEETKMPLLSNRERNAMQRGMLQDAWDAVLDIIQVRFSAVPEPTAETVRRIQDIDLLRALRKRAAVAGSIEEFQQALPS